MQDPETEDPYGEEGPEPDHDEEDHEEAYVLFGRFWNLPFFSVAMQDWGYPAFACASTFHK